MRRSTIRDSERIDIIGLAFSLSERVAEWTQRARYFFYAVVLCGYACPDCGGAVLMVREGVCRCERCEKDSDPTMLFQQCAACGGQPVLSIRRYHCQQCGADVPSRFLFDGLAFDALYFKAKMSESRQRRQDLRERVREMLATSRSRDLVLPPADLAALPGLFDALNGLTGGLEPIPLWLPRDGFDLARYERRLQAHIGPIAIRFDDLPRLSENIRQDRIWRFIAILFLASAGAIELWQEGQTIWVMKHETDREGCGVSGETEAVA